MRQPILQFCLVLLALLGGLAATRALIEPPALRSASVPGQFDAVRAKARLAAILGNEPPHPADSFGSDAVRARLIGQIRAIGLNPIVRDQFACNEIYKQRGVTCSRVRNIIVALGPASGKALLLNAHYDSTPVGPAAGDDGVGVATLLEVASLIKKERLARPVLFLFNEGEELGLVGARAFMADPLSKQVDSLVNLEARGVTGPVSMFETSLPNGPALKAFAKAADRPFANSLATDFYRQLPNYTDVNSFSERGWLTLNFAMVGNETRYHSPGDTLAALDPRSLQHMGDQTLAVTRHLAADAPAVGGSVLFADIAGRQLVVIPQLAGFVLLGLLTVGLAVVAVRRGGLWRGLALVVAALALAAGLAWFGAWLIGLVRPGSFWRAHPVWTELAVYASGIAAASASLSVLGRALSLPQLRSAFWLGVCLLGVAIFFVAPGGVIYFLLPPLVALAAMLLSRRWPRAEAVAAIIAAALLWLTWGEVTALLGQLLNNGPFFALAPLAMLIAMPWLIEAKALLDRCIPPAALGPPLALVVGAWGIVAFVPAYSADRQQRFVIQHVTNPVTGSSWAVANDRAPLPHGFGGPLKWRWAELPYLEVKRWLAPAAPVAGLKPPQIDVLANRRSGELRTVGFRLRPNGAETVTLIAPKDAQIVAAGSGGYVRPIFPDASGKYYLSCSGRSCLGATMQFTTRVKQRIGFSIAGTRRGLPPAGRPLLEQRPSFARPQYAPDSTVAISRMFL